ncbi:MAG: lytic murein transglycosylase [Halodesulfovibrio sp.]
MTVYQKITRYDNPCSPVLAGCRNIGTRGVALLRAMVFSLALGTICGCAGVSSSHAQDAHAAVPPKEGLRTISVDPLKSTEPTEPELVRYDEGWNHLVEKLVADGFDRTYVESLFGRVENPYSAGPMGHKMRALFTTKFAPRKQEPKKTKKAPAPAIYSGVLVPENMRRARTFLETHSDSLRAMEKRFGVPKEIAVGLMLVETRLGNYLGKEQAFRNLACLAASDTLESVRPHLSGLQITNDRAKWLSKRIVDKSTWAYDELKALITYSSQSGLDPVTMPGSIYGAVGICQFMPSNILRFGVDGDGDGTVNLFHASDAMHSLANYLKFHGWKPGLSREKQNRVLRHYNNSATYANTILAVADALR